MSAPWFLKEEPIDGPVPAERRKLYWEYLKYQLKRGALKNSENHPATPPSPTMDAVIAHLREHGAKTAPDIVAETQLNYSSVRGALGRLEQLGLTTRIGEAHVGGWHRVVWQAR